MTCCPIKFFAVCTLVTLCIAALPLPSRTWARSRSVPVLLVHGFQTGAINPLTHRAPVTDPRDDWRALCSQLTKERNCRFIPVSVTDSRGQRLWSFWQVQGRPVYVSNYTENTSMTSLTCIGVYASLLAEEIQVIKQREQAHRNRVAKFGDLPQRDSLFGGYYEVKKYLKSVAHDPDSIKFERCTNVYHTKSGWLVGCEFRGKNAFGAYVRNFNWFTIRYGQVIKVDEASAYSVK